MTTRKKLYSISIVGLSLLLWCSFGARCEDTNAPAKTAPIPLKSVEAAKVAAVPAIPVYVLPEVIVIHTPQGPMAFASEVHVKELAKLFPAQRLTNVVIYNK